MKIVAGIKTVAVTIPMKESQNLSIATD